MEASVLLGTGREISLQRSFCAVLRKVSSNPHNRWPARVTTYHTPTRSTPAVPRFGLTPTQAAAIGHAQVEHVRTTTVHPPLLELRQELPRKIDVP